MNLLRRLLAPASIPFALLLGGCASSGPALQARSAEPAGAPAPVLRQSLYARNDTGGLGEADLQKILESPIDLVWPARIGVVPLSGAFDAGGSVSLSTRTTAADRLARGLIGTPQFSHVSDVSTDVPNTGGIEGLRVIAARYRLRYLVLYSERFEDESHLNNWAWTYPTLVGMFLVPGVTVQSRGIAQADLLDVRTGTVLFSVVEPMRVSQHQWMVGAERSHRAAEAKAAGEAAERLAKRVASQAELLVAFADRSAAQGVEARRRSLPAAIADR